MDALKRINRYKGKNLTYGGIDELIRPLCSLLTDKGYITLHSCSAHIKENKRKIQWYIVFIATESISKIRKTTTKINKKYNYNITIEDIRKTGRECCGLTKRWKIQYLLWDLQTHDELVEINKNIYDSFLESLQ